MSRAERKTLTQVRVQADVHPERRRKSRSAVVRDHALACSLLFQITAAKSAIYDWLLLREINFRRRLELLQRRHH